MEGVVTLERLATTTSGLDGLVLRYGMFYGPGTGFETAPGKPAVHVDAAAQAAMLAIIGGAPGISTLPRTTAPYRPPKRATSCAGTRIQAERLRRPLIGAPIGP